MAQFYFDITDSDGFHRDEFGDGFTSADDARDHAQTLTAAIMLEELPDGDEQAVRCDLRDEIGRIVYRVKLTYRGARDPL